jgi:hypothetical protein
MVGVLRQAKSAGQWRAVQLRRDIALVVFLLHVVGGFTCYATYLIDRGINWAWY